MTTPLFVSRFGSGRPMLCLHGIEAHGVRYVGLVPHLPGWQLVAPDLRGHGRSPHGGPWTVEQHVADLMPLLHELGPDTTVLGHSYGGLLAWELARAAPDAVARLILVDPAINVTEKFARQSVAAADFWRAWKDRAEAASELFAARPPEAHWSVALDLAVGLWDGPAGVVKVKVHRKAVEAGWRQMTEPLNLSPFRGPTLLIEARRANGAYCTLAAVAGLREQLGDRLRHSIIDAPHTVTADAPELLAQVITFAT